MIPRIILTPGEPAGVGPDITIMALQKKWSAELVVCADHNMLLTRSKQLKLAMHLLPVTLDKQPSPHIPGTIKILPIALARPATVGVLNIQNSQYVIMSLEKAVHGCVHKQFDALVTGPVQKSILNEAGYSFSGHTEFLAQQCKEKKTLEPIMLFVSKQMRVAFMTTHLPLSAVSAAITSIKIEKLLSQLNEYLKKYFISHSPCIYICGLNPHAGEQGHLGREEIEIMIPTLNKLRQQGMNIVGPLPADTIFQKKYLQDADVIVAMYHDQALPVLKYQGFGKAVNVTLGLPFIRTSVDHGTALKIAGKKLVDSTSLMNAIKVAIKMVKKKNA